MTRSTNSITAFIFVFLAILLVCSRIPLQHILPPAGFVVAAAVLAGGLFWYLDGRRAVVVGIISLVIFCAILVILSFVTQSFYPAGHDGYGYHITAVWDLAKGWYPFLNHHNNIWVDSYPSGYWTIQSYIVALTGLPFAGMSLLLGLTVLVAFQAYGFFHDHLPVANKRLRLVTALLMAALIAGNPVVLVQLHTHYVDAPLYLIGAAIIFFMLDNALQANRLARVGTMAAIVLLLNTKTSALYFGPLIIFGGLLIELTLNRSGRSFLANLLSWFKEKGIAYILVGIFSIVVVGYKPFLTNILDHGALLYPDSGRIMDTNTPLNVDGDMPTVVKFFYGVFAKSEDNFYDVPVDAPIHLKIPGSFSKPEFTALYFDTRRGGFGPFFSLALIASLLAYGACRLASRNNTAYTWRREGDAMAVYGGTLFLASAFFPESWWARYVPFLWLGCVFLAITPVYLSGRGSLAFLSRALMGIAMLAFLGCMLAAVLGAARQHLHVYQRAERLGLI